MLLKHLFRNDNEAVDDFGKYFTSDGIQKQEERSLSDLK